MSHDNKKDQLNKELQEWAELGHITPAHVKELKTNKQKEDALTKLTEAHGTLEEAKKNADTSSADRDERCEKVAESILSILANRAIDQKTPIPAGGSVDEDEKHETAKNAVRNDVLPMLEEYDVAAMEVEYCFQLALEKLQWLQSKTNQSVAEAFDYAQKLQWGVENMNDIRLSDIVAVQQRHAQNSDAEGVDNSVENDGETE